MKQSDFINYVEKLGINLTDTQLNQLETYYEMLIEWNKKMNLTGITDKDQVYLKHFYDSLTICNAIDLSKSETLCDIGSGAGFPGMVLKIVFPNLNITLVDSLNKRIIYLNEVIKTLKLEKIEALHCRIEDYARCNRDKFDIVTARAVTSLPVLLEYAIPLVKINGYFIPLKSNVEEELLQSNKALNILNTKLIDEINFNLPIENSKRTILKFKKNSDTNKKFPRKYSDIVKKPL